MRVIFRKHRKKLIVLTTFVALLLLAVFDPESSDREQVARALRNDDTAEAARHLKDLAARGDREAQSTLGTFYLTGRGIPQDYSAAMRWLYRAANQNDADAAYSIGTMFATGLGVEKSQPQAANWFRTAAQLGLSNAQMITALNYANGYGLPKDDTMAARWFYRAASQGVVEAQITLASIYASGSGFPQNKVAAMAWAMVGARNASKPENRNRADQLQTLLRAAMTLQEYAASQNIALAWAPVAEARPKLAPIATIERDGFLASLAVGRESEVRWRFLAPLKAQISEITAQVDGKAIGRLVAEPYAQLKTSSSIVLLLDASDPTRGPQIDQAKQMLQKLAAQKSPNESLDIAAYAANVSLLDPRDSGPDAVSEIMQSVAPRNETGNLGRALRYAIELPSLVATERRGIYILTDGHADDTLNVTDLIDRAKARQTSISFLLQNGARANDLAQLTMLAQSTGGRVVGEAGFEEFLEGPYWPLSSGGTARFVTPLAARPFWEADPEIKIAFTYGTDTLEIKSRVKAPVAGYFETAAIAFGDRPVQISAAAIFASGALLLLAMRLRKRKANLAVAADVVAPEGTASRQDTGSAFSPIVGVLHNIDSGAAYPIRGPAARFGRADVNEIVLDNDPTVSRLHAIFRRNDNGTLEVENFSPNGTFINHQSIKVSALVDGDIITMGETTLHFIASNHRHEGLHENLKEQTPAAT